MARSALPSRTVALARARFDEVYRAFDHVASASDPVHLVRPYALPADREVAAFCASALAFGRVAGVLHTVSTLLAVMGPHPAAFVRRFDVARDGGALAGLGPRWIRDRDLVALVVVLQHMLLASGTIEAFFAEEDDPEADDVSGALEAFSARALGVDLRAAYGARRGPGPGVGYFFPRPSSGSACKRLNLFLRWMVRRDAIDLGVWSRVGPARLIVPLDTHVIRLGRCLRLTRYTSPGWKMALEITRALRAIDPADPVRFDFSLCHVGMMHACGFGRPQGDAQCPLRGLCRPRQTSGSSKVEVRGSK